MSRARTERVCLPQDCRDQKVLVVGQLEPTTNVLDILLAHQQHRSCTRLTRIVRMHFIRGAFYLLLVEACAIPFAFAQRRVPTLPRTPSKTSSHSNDPQVRLAPTPRPRPTPAPRPTAQPQWAPPYPRGVWGQYGVGHDIDPGLVANLGIVGIGVSDDWDEVEAAPGVYEWSTLDSKIAEAKAAGFQYISLAVTDSSSQTPTWLLDSLPADQKIALIDPANTHDTFCQPIVTALPWNATFHQARLALIAAMGARYSSDPAIVAVNMASFANHNTQDWNMQDTVGTIICPSCPQPPPTLCGDIYVDQPSQWLPAGWTEPQMLQIGKEMCDAAAAAFPNQNIKLPIGGLDITYPAFSGGTYTTLCRDIENYVYGNASLGIPPRPYANRFYMQRNTVAANWTDGSFYDTYTPGFNGQPYIKYMIRAHAHPNPPWTTPRQAGLQMIGAATLGATTRLPARRRAEWSLWPHVRSGMRHASLARCS